MFELLKFLLVCIIVYAAYILVFAFLPYFLPQKISEEFKKEVDSYDFYGDRPCVDRVALVEDPLISLATRIRLINEAEKTLDIAYYALHMGQTTDFFLASVLDAAQRGVRVRFLIDGMFHGFSGEYKYLAAALGSHPNIEIKLYNRINPLKPWTFNGRMHDKYIIVDNRIMLLGGRNIGDKYFGGEDYCENLTIDRDVMVYNTEYDTQCRQSVLFDVRKYMLNIWDNKIAKTSFAKRSKKSEEQQKRLFGIMKELRESSRELFVTPLNLDIRTHKANKVTFFANDHAIYKKEPKVGYIIKHIAATAKKRVFLQSPYVVLSENIYQSLKEVGEQPAEYEILTNSMHSSPNLPAFSLYMSDRKKILDTGAKIYEFHGDDSIHAKTYIIDDRMSIIGSFNMDPRGEYIDTEIMLAIDSVGFTATLENIINQYKNYSLCIDSKGAYDLSESEECYDDEDSKKKKLLKIVGKVISPFRILI